MAAAAGTDAFPSCRITLYLRVGEPFITTDVA